MVNSQNQRVSAPYGDVFFVNTPYLDRVSNTLYLEQKQRQAKLAQDAAALNDEFSKNAANIRDADVPELTKKWSDYKNAWVNLQKTKGNAPDRIQREMDLMRSKADMYSLVNRSKEGKVIEEEDAKDYLKNPDRYQNNARDILSFRRKIPITHPEYDGLREGAYWRLGTTDFSKDFNSAVGKVGLIGKSEPVPTSNGLEWQTSSYRGIPNTAPQIAETFLKSVVGSQKTSDLVKEHPELTDPATLQAIDEKYNELINSDLYKKAYKGKQIEFPKWMEETPHGKVAMYLAKQAVLNNPVTEEKDKPYANYEAQQRQKNAEWNRRNSLTFRQSMEKIAANKVAGKPVEDTGYISDNVADEVGETVEMNDGTTKRVIDVTNIDPERLKIINGAGDPKKLEFGVAPIQMYDSKLKKNRLVYYQDQETGDWIGKDGQKISREAAKDRYVNKYSPTAFKSKTNTQAQEKKAGVANQSSGNAKTISTSRLKGLVGTKGYEGYSLQEIIDYYKSNGYKVD